MLGMVSWNISRTIGGKKNPNLKHKNPNIAQLHLFDCFPKRNIKKNSKKKTSKFYNRLISASKNSDLTQTETTPERVKKKRAGLIRDHELERQAWCLFICSARWSEREKQRLHTAHWKGLAPVCFLKWRVSSSERAKRHSHPSQEHSYGFSPAATQQQQQRYK